MLMNFFSVNQPYYFYGESSCFVWTSLDLIPLMDGGWTSLCFARVPLFGSFSVSFYAWFTCYCSSVWKRVHTLFGYNSSFLCPTVLKNKNHQIKKSMQMNARSWEKWHEFSKLDFLRTFSMQLSGPDPKSFTSDLRFLTCCRLCCLSIEGEQWLGGKRQRKIFLDRYCPSPRSLRVHWQPRRMTFFSIIP